MGTQSKYASPRLVADPCSNVYGVARTLLALSTALTLSANRLNVLFTPAVGVYHAPTCEAGFWGRLSLFCLVPEQHLDLVRWLCCFALLVVASGWRPRITGIFHAWISYTVFSSITVREGGDQVALVLTVLLLPVTLADSRPWHWSSAENKILPGSFRAILVGSSFQVIRVQIAIIYFVAAISKLGVAEWKDGTALYYWLPYFSAPHWIVWMAGYGWFVAAATWGALFVEMALAAGLILRRRYWPRLLVAGILFHVGIALLFGLWAFSLCMTAALILYLRPANHPFHATLFQRLLPALNFDELHPETAETKVGAARTGL